MIDSTNTTLDWQVHPGDVCVLPVGSLEQHGTHLPLTSDTILADAYGQMIATDLDAALLPSLPYANCLEHSGFRGSVSLRPETLMQVIRDIADEVERQHFRILILANAHGGNFPLKPVARDINRMDRPLKVILVDCYAFCDDDIAADSRSQGREIHAGEWETSHILALRPDLVRADSQDMPPPPADHPLAQNDLTTFGVGHFHAKGNIGFPSLATKEKGDAILASIRKNLIPFLRDRIERLRQQPRYAGPGGIALRSMLPRDIDRCMELKQLAGWNQVHADWDLFLKANPQGCLVAVHNGLVVGTVTTVNYEDKVSWIGMVLVDPAMRRLGIAKRLMQAAIDHLATCEAVKLDATPAGKKVYDKLGFLDEYALRRLVIEAVPPVSGEDDDVKAVDDEALARIIEYDLPAFGADRSLVLRALCQRSPGTAWSLVRNGQLNGYCLGRDGAHFHQLGPVMAETPTDAIALAKAALAQLTGKPVIIDVSTDQKEFGDWLAGMGFAEQRPFMRMYKGENRNPGKLEKCFAIAAPELG